MSATSQYPAVDGIVGPYPTTKGERWGVRLKGFERFGLRSKADAVYTRDRHRTEKYEQKVSPEKFAAKKSKKVTIADLMQLVVEDYQRNGHKSLKDAREMQGFWTRFQGSMKAAHVTRTLLLAWADQWIKDGYSPATVNRRMQKLHRGYQLGKEHEPPLVLAIPKWSKLQESAPRSGFMEWDTFQILRNSLPPHVRIPITIEFWTGMRPSEVHSLTWSQVVFDHAKQRVRLQLTGLTKNGQPRQVIMPGDMYEVLSQWRDESQLTLCPFVCQYRGRQLGTYDLAWKSACVRLGLATGDWQSGRGYYKNYVGPLVYDLRRTGARNLRRAGVDRDTCKSITGHLTDSVFTRYNIVDERDLEDAGEKVVADLAKRFSVGMVKGMGQAATSKDEACKVLMFKSGEVGERLKPTVC